MSQLILFSPETPGAREGRHFVKEESERRLDYAHRDCSAGTFAGAYVYCW